LSQAQGRTARLLESLLQLPVVIPPAVAGVALLLAFGRRGLVASLVGPEWGALSFTTAAVVLAQLFVAAPLFVQGALAAFRALDPEVVLAARALGAGPVRVLVRVAIPMAGPGLIAGAALCWARALGEFGATITFAANIPDETRTLTLAIYTALQTPDGEASAKVLVMISMGLAIGALLLAEVSNRVTKNWLRAQ
jgi:molybdate transport system permease protein